LLKREGPRLFPFFLSRRYEIRVYVFLPFALIHPRKVVAFALELPPFAPATAGRQVHPRKVVAFVLELQPFALIFSRNVLVQSSRLERVRFVCFQ
jgi:hypothetical protein